MTEIEDAEVVESKEIVPQQRSALAVQDELTIEQLTAQVQKVQEAMKAVMKDGEHYGVIPGTNKPTLLKPGAEKLCLLFRLAPRYVLDKTWHEDGHLTVCATCELSHIPTGDFVAAGEGICSTKEKKYAYRQGQLACPECGNTETLKKSRKQGEGYYCWQKIGGCSATFGTDEPRIKSQNPGKVDNPELPDTYNTVLKMAAKRSLIAAVLNGTAASDIFTQDLEDSPGATSVSTNPSQAGEAAPGREVGSEKSEPTAAKSTQPQTDAAAPREAEEPVPASPGSSALQLITDAVWKGDLKESTVVSNAARIAAKHEHFPPDGIKYETLDQLPEEILDELAAKLKLTQAALV